MRLTLLHKGLLLVSIPLCFEIGLFSVLITLQNDVERQAKHINQILKVDQCVNQVVRDLSTIAVQFGEAGGARMNLTLMKTRVALMRQHFKELREAGQNQPQVLAIIEKSQQDINSAELAIRETQLRALGAALESRSVVLSQGAHEADNYLLDALNGGLLQLASANARELAQDNTANTRHAIMLLLKCAMGLSVILGIVGATIYSRHLIGRLSRVRANARNLAGGTPLLMPLSGSDEIAQLDQSFHWAAELIEQNLRKEKAILSNARDLICSFDDKFKLKTINPAGEELLGQEAETLIGRSFLALIATDDKVQVDEALQGIAKTGTSAELSASLTADGNSEVRVDISVSYSPQDGAYYAVIHDVTLKRQLEQVKQQVTAMITHDLRTPLQSVRNYLEMLRTGKLGELNQRGLKLLDLTEQESHRMTRLIESVLQLEKLRSGVTALDRQPVPLNEILPKSVGAVQLIAAGKSIDITLQPSDLIVMGDANWLEQVCVNILANAVNYSPDGSRVAVSSKRKGNFGEIRVSDQGAGISEEEKALIFERFHRISASAQKVTGSGLGLSICKELVDLHRGYIHVESELGKGSTFIIGIPMIVLPNTPSNKA